MNVGGTVNAVLRHKGNSVWSVSPDATVFEAISKMAEKNVGALLVMEQGRLVGVISERDYTRNVVLRGRASASTAVREILSPMPISVTADEEVAECMRLMTIHRIRHLPVVEGQRVVGVVSIGDLVNWVISAQETTIDQLQGYISGAYPG